MAWREITTEEGVWKVHQAAERRPYADSWQLMLSFASSDQDSPNRFWAPYPLEATSRTSLFVQAERIADEELEKLVLDHVTG